MYLGVPFDGYYTQNPCGCPMLWWVQWCALPLSVLHNLDRVNLSCTVFCCGDIPGETRRKTFRFEGIPVSGSQVQKYRKQDSPRPITVCRHESQVTLDTRSKQGHACWRGPRRASAAGKDPEWTNCRKAHRELSVLPRRGQPVEVNENQRDLVVQKTTKAEEGASEGRTPSPTSVIPRMMPSPATKS